MVFSDVGADSKGIISFTLYGEKKRVYNPFLVAVQALLGENIFYDYENQQGSLIPKYIPLNDLLDAEIDSCRQKAMDWLFEEAVQEEDTLKLYYLYDAEYNGQQIKAGWLSSYAQAYAILAMLFFWDKSGKEEYKNAAEKAANCLIRPMEKRGCSRSLSEFECWFEELPLEKGSFIFNAHMISLIALYELNLRVKDAVYEKAFNHGLNAFLRRISWLDSGTGSAYAIPRQLSVTLLIDILKGDAAFGKISLKQGGQQYEINLARNDCFEVADSYASGIDWMAALDENGYRCIVKGREVRTAMVPGGDIQNTFLNFNHISVGDSVCELEIDYAAREKTELVIKKNTVTGFREIPCCRFELSVGKGRKIVSIPSAYLQTDVTRFYHDYHIELLSALEKITNNLMIKSVSARIKASSIIGGDT